MKRRTVIWIAVFALLGNFGCGTKKVVEEKRDEKQTDDSEWQVNMCYMESGFLYKNPDSGKMEYYDYQTRKYRPLCAEPNCEHKTEECEAVYLAEKADFIGRYKERWYYFCEGEEGERAFYSCDLDGAGEKKIGEFAHHGGTFVASKVIFSEGSCLIATCEDVLDEKTYEWTGKVISGIYRFNLETGEETVFCEEKENTRPSYCIYGMVEGKLLYTEWNDQGCMVKAKDLESGEEQIIQNSGVVVQAAGTDNGIVFQIQENGKYELKEVDMKHKTEASIEMEEAVGDIFWSDEIKSAIAYDEKGLESRIYLYEEPQKAFELIRQVKSEETFVPCKSRGEMLIGRDADGIAVMSEKDYLAGKTTWEKLKAE
ncbi:MAG: hypothetical protein V8S96_06980 [Lachnospiraceae bacterium]